ncbi:bifunctional nuclease family protein [Propionimicrobium sp. PCR01-08-3]|uniref:bifunctional nuclease family protein n=1 Tax=Propionimicrobium sp. PCR01-08-3 TaxID=3052086 RepID=UPI00255C67C8|nr:bifunctional nuclease family protein [Propionimicrobium sp. PCR01-08-3]WIY84076.1 bifunctional nuclease family protein [Propionimicrobium sp. PCR01-08-3]
MIELDIMGVRVEVPSNAPMLLLKESGGQRYLPIWIGAAEASAIVNALEGIVPERPMTHDLMADLLSQLGHVNLEGRITTVNDGTFYAELWVDGHVISARPSDVAALALRSGFKLTCPSELLDQVGVELSEPAEDEVEKFREFLDHISPDDFEN